MTYEVVATVSQVISLLMFIAMFAGVVCYAIWPTNGLKFDTAQKRALGLESEKNQTRGTP